MANCHPGASSLVLSLTSFPWASLFKILQKRGYFVDNWPPATPTPNQGGNTKGISGLSMDNLLAILEACEAAENPLTFVQVAETRHDGRPFVRRSFLESSFLYSSYTGEQKPHPLLSLRKSWKRKATCHLCGWYRGPPVRRGDSQERRLLVSCSKVAIFQS